MLTLIKKSINLDEIMARAHKKIPKIDIDRIKLEYQRFLVLAFTSLDPKNRFTCRPSPTIDIVWHEHILSTKQYEADCKLIGGQFLHHTPETKPSDDDKEKKDLIKTDHKYMLDQYKLLFGENAPSDIWGINADEQDKDSSLLKKRKIEEYDNSWDCITCG